MSKCLMIVPMGLATGASSLAMGLIHRTDQLGLDVQLFLPVEQKSSSMVKFAGVEAAMTVEELQRNVSLNEIDEALEHIVAVYQEQVSDDTFAIVLGLSLDAQTLNAQRINAALAKTLDARVLLVCTDVHDAASRMNTELELAAEAFGGIRGKRVVGCVVNKAGAPRDIHGQIRPELFSAEAQAVPELAELEARLPIFKSGDFQLFGIIPWRNNLVAPRTQDVEKLLPVEWLNAGEADARRIEHITIGIRTSGNLVSVLQRGTFLVTGGDRDDVLLAAALAELNGIPLAGLLLTGGLTPSENTLKLIAPALASGLPLLSTSVATYPCATRLPDLYQYLADDDQQRYQAVVEHVVDYLDADKFRAILDARGERRLSPAAFRYNLIKRSRLLKKTIVLPEGDEPRTIAAAIICMEKEIAQCILLAQPDKVRQVAEAQGLVLPESLQIVDPASIAEQYVAPFVALREHKGMNEVRARQLLEDTVVLGTMMLQQDDVAGLVSGAVHTTANTILPAFQLIKTEADAALVSSIFFMCLPDQVLVYGDCAVNPDPTAEQLADIAIQSADSARAFGIPPRVAMISYSTGSSGSGKEVEKVAEATRIAQQLRPDLLIDGPLQYDAATNAGVARSKAPDSPVAGKATVFIFPDLNTGNTTYKAVQRSANVVSVGPMLQGLNKPVNDLSRGALIDDIVYTIALTAIQAGA